VTEAGVQLLIPAATAIVASNDVELGAGTWFVDGDAASDLTIDTNVVTYDNVPSFGLGIDGVGTSMVSGNTFTDLGTPAANAVAFAFATDGAPIALSANGNTFANFSRALYVADAAAPADGIDATIQNNVFDFTIDAAPKVAELNNVKDVIDARFNQWGANTVLATVQGYV